MTRTTVFDTSLQQAHEWLLAVDGELGTFDQRSGLTALRAALHVVRDSLTMRQAIELGDRLPVLVRGLYYEGWSPGTGGGPAAASDVMDQARHDIRGHDDLAPADKTLRACFNALDRLLPQDEARTVLSALPAAIKEMWPNALRVGEPQNLQGWQWG